MGNLTLGDGAFGDEGNLHENWLGFQYEDMIAVIDFGEMKNISKVSANFLQDINSWIFLPGFVEISISTDGKNFRIISKVENPIPQAEKKPTTYLFKANFSAEQARYVRVTAGNIGVCPEWHKGAGGKAWLFVDEIIVE